MSYLFRKLAKNNPKNIIHDVQIFVISCRKLSIVPSLYDGEQDPAPKFFSSNVQVMLKRLTRPDYSKVFRKRTNQGLTILKTPSYKFLTNEELEAELANAEKKAEKLLQMPPVVKIQKHIDDVLSNDPALIGYDTAKYLFTDITFGVANEHRFIIERDPDGILRSCDHDVRKRLNQTALSVGNPFIFELIFKPYIPIADFLTYFPMNGRKLREPLMFTDQEKLYSLLDREKYEFVLDRACVQYEPDEPSYQKITSITYQHIDTLSKYELLRSTRHFGPLVFYLTWHQSIDNLMLELLQNNAVRDAVMLTALRQDLHGDVVNGEILQSLVHQVLATPIQLTKPECLTEADIQLDSKCLECIDKYIKTNSSMKSQHELALQGFRENYQQLIELSRGLKKAHGKA